MKKLIKWVQGVIATVSAIRKKWDYNLGVLQDKVAEARKLLNEERIDKVREQLDDIERYIEIARKIL